MTARQAASWFVPATWAIKHNLDPELVFRHWSSFYHHTPGDDFSFAVCTALLAYHKILAKHATQTREGADAHSTCAADFDSCCCGLTAILFNKICDMDEDWKPVLAVDWLLEDLKAMMTAAILNAPDGGAVAELAVEASVRRRGGTDLEPPVLSARDIEGKASEDRKRCRTESIGASCAIGV